MEKGAAEKGEGDSQKHLGNNEINKHSHEQKAKGGGQVSAGRSRKREVAPRTQKKKHRNFIKKGVGGKRLVGPSRQKGRGDQWASGRRKKGNWAIKNIYLLW